MRALIVVAALVAGCAGTRFSFEDARQVTVGMTEAEVVERLGKPYMVTSRGDSQIWVWSQANGFTGSSQAVTFIFRDGKVVTVPTIPASFR